ncbi:acetyl-CoA acetyltransferase [Neobacillus novalis]|uniref:Acetyl-CoA acetyltransferase n=1 Tax=Neobacillus novalis TaxID=220687 RepID=A0AA95S6S2_9BACI|nr:acetyl-CoA acetyltransferase [Neobacillus novalis]WHY83985.1 acetyl-CoA acetyltransferase [Neobacillus novalis]
MSERVAIIGLGATRFTEHFDKSYGELVEDAAFKALKMANLELNDIEAAWLGTCYAYEYGTEGNAGTSLAEALGIYGIPISRVANYCITGLDAIRNAVYSVQAGAFKRVLVVGAEKMRDVPPRDSLVATHAENGHPIYAKGRTAPGMFGIMANRYFETYGNSKNEMAMVSVKNHYHGSLNPRAHFRGKVSLEQVINAPMVADPIGLLDCTPTSDGAAAVVITTESEAKALGAEYVVISGIGVAVTSGYFTAQFDPNWDFLSFQSTKLAAQAAYKQAGITDPLRQIDVAEVHDCFTITEMINYEDLGFCGPGKGGTLLHEGVTTLGGCLPVNVSGGLQSCGHPIGASGVRMVVDIAEQLLEKSGPRQVNNSRIGLTHALGGPGSVAGVSILERVN